MLISLFCFLLSGMCDWFLYSLNYLLFRYSQHHFFVVKNTNQGMCVTEIAITLCWNESKNFFVTINSTLSFQQKTQRTLQLDFTVFVPIVFEIFFFCNLLFFLTIVSFLQIFIKFIQAVTKIFFTFNCNDVNEFKWKVIRVVILWFSGPNSTESRIIHWRFVFVVDS